MDLLVVILVGALVGAWLHSRALTSATRDMRDEFARERDVWHRERQLLLNRIKPETAQAVFDPTLQPGPEFQSAVPYDDDDAFWESKEQLADRLMQEELDGAR